MASMIHSSLSRWSLQSNRVVGFSSARAVRVLSSIGRTLVGCWAIFAATPSLIAGPSDNAPFAALDPIGVMPESKELTQLATSLAYQCEKELVEIITSGKTPSAQKVVEIRANLDTAARASERLASMYEPAGFSLDFLLGDLIRRCESLGKSLASDPRSQRSVVRYSKQFEKAKSKRDKLAIEITKVFQEGKVLEAYDMIVPEYHVIVSEGVFFSPGQIQPYVQNLLNINQSVVSAIRQLRPKITNQAYVEHLQKEADQMSAFEGRLAQVKKAIFETPDASTVIDAKRIQQGFDAVVNAWHSTAATLARYATIAGLLQSDQVRGIPAAPFDGEALSIVVATELGSIIDGAKDALSFDQQRELHVQLVQRIAAIRGQIRDASISRQDTTSSSISILENAVERLAANSNDLKFSVKAYSLATTPFLQWQKRNAKKWSQSQQAKLGTVASAFSQSGTPKKTLRADIFTRPAVPKNANPSIDLFQPAHWQTSEVAFNLLGKPASLLDVQGLPSKAAVRYGVSRMRAQGIVNYYGMAPVPAWPKARLESLQQQILVTVDSPPLSVLAASAVQQANAGGRQVVGGTITSLTMEPVISRLANMVPASVVALPIDAPDLAVAKLIDNGGLPLPRRMIWRVGIRPTWMATEFDFVSN